MNNIMLDLETLGTGPNAAVIAIGACFFDIQTREIGPTFYHTLDLSEVVRGGGEMDSSTVLWWLKQSDEARRAIYESQGESAEHPNIALIAFRSFILDHATEAPKVWGNDTNFDNIILSSMYRRHQIPQPWDFWNDRGFRTAKALFPSVEIEFEGIKHHALHDAIYQSRMLIEMLNPKADPIREPGAELEEDDPLWLVNSQIEGLLEGIGASEDHEDVIRFLLASGLPRSTVDRIHKAIVWGDIKTLPTEHPSLPAKQGDIQQ